MRFQLNWIPIDAPLYGRCGTRIKFQSVTQNVASNANIKSRDLHKTHLCHVANDNSHNNSIDSNSFTENDAVEKYFKSYFTQVLKSALKLSLFHYNFTIHTHKKRVIIPDKILGFNSGGFDTTPNDAGSSDVNAPVRTRSKSQIPSSRLTGIS